MGTFKLFVVSTIATNKLLSVVRNFVNVESKKSSESQRLNSVDRVGAEFEFSAIMHMWCKVSFLDIVQLLLQLYFYGKSGRARLARNSDVVCSLIDNPKSRLQGTAFLVQWHDLHDVGVSDPYSSGVSE